MMMHKSLLIIVPLTLALVGCSSAFNPIGDSSFDCNRKQNPHSPCNSFKSVDAGTMGPLPPSRFDQTFSMTQVDQREGIAQSGSTAQRRALSPVSAPLPHQAEPGWRPALAGQPVRVGPVIQRVLIKRWVDDSDSLHEGVVVYREIKGSHWAGMAAQQAGANRKGGIYPHVLEEGSTEGALASPVVPSAPAQPQADQASATTPSPFVAPTDPASMPQ